MTPWRWWWLAEGDDSHGDWRGDCDTREEAIRVAGRELRDGTAFDVMEARSSTAMIHEGAECVPFLRTRNRERLIVSLPREQG